MFQKKYNSLIVCCILLSFFLHYVYPIKIKSAMPTVNSENAEILDTSVTDQSVYIEGLQVSSCVEEEPTTEQIEEKITEEQLEVSEIYTFGITEQERDLIARLVFLEVGAESYECKLMVVSVVFNQLMDGSWGNNIKDMIYYKGLYSTAKRLSRAVPYSITKNGYKEAWDECFQAVDEVTKNGCIIPHYVKYFSAGRYHNFKGYVGYKIVDNTYFGYFANEVTE